MNTTAPLGFWIYDVIELDTGKSHTVTQLKIEKVEVLCDFQADKIFEDALGGQLTDEPKEKAETHHFTFESEDVHLGNRTQYSLQCKF